MKEDLERTRLLQEADQDTAVQIQRYLTNKGACFLTKSIPTAINITLLPTPVSKDAYDIVIRAQEPFNRLIDDSSRDEEFVRRTITPSTSVDYLAKRLLEIYQQCKDDEDQITLGMYRHDYMFHTPDPTAEDAISNGAFKQVEANLMSAALLGIATHVMDLHNQRMGLQQPGKKQPYDRSLPPMMAGVYEAWKLYNRPGSVFLFLVAPNDFNWFDQQHMIDVLWEKYHIFSLKMTYNEFMAEGQLKDNRYYVRGREVAIFYFRSMWNEDHYPTEEHWKVRLRIEKSLAVKVPNIRHQCLNLKYFQQAFLTPGVMEKYLNADEVELVKGTFAELHTLSPGPEGDRAVQLAFDDPQGWVLKPSREGGGNNIWEDDMLKKLTELKGCKEIEAFVLMQRLKPPHVPNRFIKNQPNGPPIISGIIDTTTELGIFCVYVADKEGKVIENTVGGPILRTKPAKNNEGGIAIGIGVMDSVVFE